MPKDPNLQDEPALEPGLPIVDAHHHLWRNSRNLARYALDYMAPDLIADAQGHNVVATVYMECHSGYRRDGPEALRPVGETEFAVASGGRVGATEVCAGIVGAADLMLGEAVGEVLDAHLEAGRGRFRGVRYSASFTEDPAVPPAFSVAPPHRLLEPALRRGAGELARRGLVFDTWLFQPQLAELADFAAALPDLTIVLDHVGGYMGVGGFAERPKETFAAWRAGLAEVARHPNVVLKLGGMGMPMISPSLVAQDGQASSEAMAALWKPVFDTGVELFGPERCMLESNFPVDGLAGSYRRFWNAFKRLAAAASPAEKTALFSGTAARIYSLPGI